jgi:hypothetical protein
MTSLLPEEVRKKLKEAARLPKRERLQTIDDIILYAQQKYPQCFKDAPESATKFTEPSTY